MARKIRPELPIGTIVRVRKAGDYRITGLESWTTQAGNRIYRGVNLTYQQRESSFSECDIATVYSAQHPTV